MMSALLISVVGIRSTTDSAVALKQVLRRARRDYASPLEALAALALALCGERADDVRSVGGLRLLTSASSVPTRGSELAFAVNDLAIADEDAPFMLGRVHELLLASQDRKVAGAHLTPSMIASGVVATLDERWTSGAGAVLDPAVGGGAFLLAALDQLIHHGVDARSGLARVRGLDINPDAVAVAEMSLVLWGLRHNVDPVTVDGLQVGDGLLDDLPAAEVVVGNPPFLSQLRSYSSNVGERRTALRDRWGDLVGAYTDEAWLFLAAGANALGPRGQLTMIQPLSVLAARHGSPARAHVSERCDLTGLWLSNGRVFDAAVEVCALTLSEKSASVATQVRRWSGAEFEVIEPAETPSDATAWGRIAAPVAGIPAVHLGRRRTIGDMATATAGFRDQFYGFAPHVAESDAVEPANRLVTVGMIDPLVLRWGSADFRFAGERRTRPVIDRDGLQADDPALHEWVQQRMQPKLLVATQTRVIEVWVDERGDAIPATPVISLEPADAATCWHLAAVLTSPALSADAGAQAFGTALAVRALKLSAKAVMALPLPQDDVTWDRGADLAQSASGLKPGDERREALAELGAVMSRAYGLDDGELLTWWNGLLPIR